jgi:hypothetical protein
MSRIQNVGLRHLFRGCELSKKLPFIIDHDLQLIWLDTGVSISLFEMYYIANILMITLKSIERIDYGISYEYIAKINLIPHLYMECNDKPQS